MVVKTKTSAQNAAIVVSTSTKKDSILPASLVKICVAKCWSWLSSVYKCFKYFYLLLKTKLRVFQGKGNVYCILWKHTVWFSKCLPLLTHWKEEKKKSSEVHKLPKKRIEFSPLPSSTPVLGGSFDKDSGQPADAIYLWWAARCGMIRTAQKPGKQDLPEINTICEGWKSSEDLRCTDITDLSVQWTFLR